MPKKSKSPKVEVFNSFEFICRFEEGECNEEEVVAGFQHLIDSGMAWSLQGSYGRTAAQLIESGLCRA